MTLSIRLRVSQVDRSLLNSEERLAAFFLFRALYPEQDIPNNPFVAYLIEVSRAVSLSSCVSRQFSVALL